MSEQVWYYAEGERQVGPVGLEEMRELVRRGVVVPQTSVWREGMSDWTTAGQMGELFGAGPVYTPGAAGMGAAGPGTTERPTPLTVFGILNIVFGTLGVICTPISLVFLYMPSPEGGIVISPEMRLYSTVGGVIGILAGFLLIAAGIGLLNRRAWARKVSYWYGWFAVVWGVIGLAANVFLIGSQMERSPEMVGSVCGGMCGSVLGLIYPVLLIIFMRKPRVVEACDQ